MAPKKTPDTSPSPGTRPRLQLSAVQVLASALAAITATIAGSFLGVNGTVIGAAVASVLTVTANAIYAHSLRRTGERVRTAAPVARVRTATLSLPPIAPPIAAPIAAPTTAPTVRTRTRPRPFAGWRRLGVATAMLFITLLGVVTASELITGRPVSDLLRGTSGSGTTVFGASSSHPNTATTPAPQPAVTVTDRRAEGGHHHPDGDPDGAGGHGYPDADAHWQQRPTHADADAARFVDTRPDTLIPVPS
ncbi:MAG TPA: hypothetical protein VGH01_09105 [Jatrophihabitantaceae bacterium]